MTEKDKRKATDIQNKDRAKIAKNSLDSDTSTSTKFGDPKYDVTFKMLFGNDKNKDILISLLNSLLGFTGDSEIIDVEINSNELPVSVFSEKKGESGIASSVDVLCTNKGEHKIAIEMQGQKTKYFLSREQEYMSKLISGQVKEGEGKQHHKKVLQTYIIVIGKDNIFTGDTALKDQKLFEIDVVPTVIQTQEIFPENKMHWKFFELPKFKKSNNYKNIGKDSDLKDQWLEFLIDCSKSTEEPERNEIIKKGYKIMEVAKWDPDTKALYWKQLAQEQDLLEQQEMLRKEEFEKGLEKGELVGKLKGEISKVKTLLKYGIDQEKIIGKLKFLIGDNKDKTLKNIDYIQIHIEDTDSDICESLGLVDEMFFDTQI